MAAMTERPSVSIVESSFPTLRSFNLDDMVDLVGYLTTPGAPETVVLFRVIRGCRGDIEAVVSGFLAGFILDSGVGCSAHAEDHECAHHE